MTVLFVMLIGACVVLFLMTPSGFVPSEDRGFVIGTQSLPDAATLQRTDAMNAKLLKMVMAEPGVDHVTSLVGLDVIGNKLTEINVTSPTCFQEITDQTGFDVPAMFMDALEAALHSQTP